MKSQAIGYILLLIIVEILAWYFLKKQHIEENDTYIFLFFLLFSLIPWILIQLVRLEGIAITNVYWNIASTMLVILLGYFVFKEKINSVQYIGVGLGILSITLLTIAR
jgi:multidrug transporter EmrE-like cation transporter